MILTPERFRDKFMLSKAPYWWAYNARNKKEMLDKFRNDDESLEGDDLLNYSWLQIEEMIDSYPYGHVQFVLKTSPSANIDQSPKMYVKWGETPSPGSIRQRHKGVQTIGSASNALLELMLNMQQRNFDQQLALTRELIEMKGEKRELESAIAGLEEPSLKEAMLMRGVDVLEKVLTTPRITPPQQPAAALGTVGQKSPPGIEATQTNTPSPAFSLDLALQHIQAIKQAIPEYPINDIIKVLAIYVQQNTEQARNLISALIQQLPEYAEG